MSRIGIAHRGVLRAARPVTVAILLALLPLVAGTFVWRWSNGPTWDEAVYVARATLADHWRDLWGTSRMFGVPLVIAPFLAVTDTLAVTRVGFALVTAVLAVTAARWWMRIMGPAFLASFATLVVSWQFLWFAPALMPNLPAGLATLALCGWSVLVLHDDDRPPGAMAGAAVAFVAFSLRWVDALLLWGPFVVLLACAAWWTTPARRRSTIVPQTGRTLRRLSPALAGVTASMLVWVLESRVLFGSAWSRLTDAGDPGAVGQPLREQLVKMIWFNTGESVGDGTRHLLTFVHLPALLVVSAIGVVVVRGRAAAPVRAAWVAGVGLFVFYLWATVHIRVVASGDSLHRFVVPAIIFASVPVGAAVSTMVESCRRRSWWATAALGVTTTILSIAAVGSASLLGPIQNVEGDTGASTRSAAARMNGIAAGRECFFYVQYNYPAMQLETPCRGERLAFHRSGPAVDDPILSAPVSFLYGNIPPAARWQELGWVEDSTHGAMTLWVRDGSD